MKPIDNNDKQHTQYAPDAFAFVREALSYTTKSLNKPEEGPLRHVSGKELMNGFREYALQQFGPMAIHVLDAWGIRRTEDIGAIVFAMVEAGELGKTDEDERADFAHGYDFFDVFAAPFLPKSDERRRTV